MANRDTRSGCQHDLPVAAGELLGAALMGNTRLAAGGDGLGNVAVRKG